MSVTKLDYSNAMTGFTKLFGSIVHSTVWREDMPTKVVWITMLALADRNGRVLVSVPGLADAARVPLEDTVAALAKLASPDEWSRTKLHEGRRIEEIDGGWILLNYMKYREQRDADERRMKVRDAVQRYREKKSQEVTVIAGKHNAEAEAEAEAETETESPVRRPPPSEPKRTKTRPAATAPGPRAELNWRVEQTWLAHLAQWREFFRSVNGAVPSLDPTLTEEIREAIREALLTYDGALLGPDQRETWLRQSKARAAGIGIFLDPWCTGQHKDNEATNGGKRYLEHWRPWKRQRGKGDPVDRFSELYFEVQSVAT